MSILPYIMHAFNYFCNTMKAIQLIDKEKEPIVSEVPIPLVEEGCALVNVSFSAMNHRDLWIAKGKYSKIKYPIIPGSDLCGYIDNRRVLVNPGFYWGNDENVQSKNFQILGLPENGSFAEYVTVPKEYIYSVPDHLNDMQAAALPLAGITAYRALFTKCKAVKGENILITGIGGGVALQILQFAIALELNVYVSSSDDLKIQRAIDLGAKGGVNYLNDEWDQELNTVSGGMHIVIDSAAGKSFNKLLNVCLPGARICNYGGTQGTISELSPQIIFWKQLSVFGTMMGTQYEFKKMIEFVTDHRITPIVDHVFILDEIKEAFQRMERKEQFGKIVLSIQQ